MTPPFLGNIIQDNMPFVAVFQYSKVWRVLSINDDTTSVISLDAYNNMEKRDKKEKSINKQFGDFLKDYCEK